MLSEMKQKKNEGKVENGYVPRYYLRMASTVTKIVVILMNRVLSVLSDRSVIWPQVRRRHYP